MTAFFTRRPSGLLGRFVEILWYYESRHAHAREIVLPSARSQLLVSLENRGMASAMVRGASTKPQVIDPTAMKRMVGAVFRAGGVRAISGVPALELQDAGVALGELHRSETQHLTDGLFAAGSPAAMVVELEQWLTARFGEPSAELSMIARGARLLARGSSVGDTIDRLGTSRSRFVRHFSAEVGTTPKQFASLVRFQRAVRGLAAGERDLAALAVACGYFDQAHLTHEFRRFSGRTPTRYRPRDPREPNHLID